jgi:hypothetical protein
MCRPVGQVGDVHCGEGFAHAPGGRMAIEAEIERAEGHILEDAGGKELVVWVLEDETDGAAPQRQAFAVVAAGSTINADASIARAERAVQGQQ